MMELRAEEIKKEFIRAGSGSNIFTAVEPCSLVIPAGLLTLVHGRSGSGKSTLLNMLAGILRPTEGVVFMDGEDLYEKTDQELSRFRNRKIGYIPQGRSAISSLTILENVALPFSLCEEDGEAKAEEMMERFGILDLRDIMPDRLSGGELRRMAIARALVRSPQVIFADEPTGDLDDENTHLVFGVLRDLAREGAAVLAVTHEEDAFAYADRIFTMNAGKLAEASAISST